MALDAIDQYLDPLTENVGNHEYQLLRTIYVEQLEKDKNFEFKWKSVYIFKLCHEDHPTTKEDFYIGLTNNIHRMLTYHRSNSRSSLPDNEGTKLNKYIQQNGEFDCFKYTILQKKTLSFSIEDQLNLNKYWIDKLQPNLNEQQNIEQR